MGPTLTLKTEKSMDNLILNSPLLARRCLSRRPRPVTHRQLIPMATYKRSTHYLVIFVCIGIVTLSTYADTGANLKEQVLASERKRYLCK